MNFIISESQVNNIIPYLIKRRYSELEDALYEMLYNTDYGAEVTHYPKSEFINYIAEELIHNVLKKYDLKYIQIIKFIFEPVIGKFWDERNKKYKR